MNVDIKYLFLILTTSLLSLGNLVAQDIYACRDGYVYWVSEAPLELIEAKSDNLQGLIRPSDGSFAFSMSIRSFSGFNSPLQQEHFHENYMETESFSRSTFSGKIIGEIDWDTPGTYTLRAKGTLEVHGVTQERIIDAQIEVGADGAIDISSNFSILLADHEIRIPRIVMQKIAEEISVQVRANMYPDRS